MPTTDLCNVCSPQELYDQLKNVQTDNPLCRYTLERCQRLFPLIHDIIELKAEKNAVILAHSYVHPDIIYGVADHTGDSYGLSLEAQRTSADVILFPAVRFMAETAKILNPTKTVIDPNPQGGCSLAESIDAEIVKKLREKHPHHTFVCYINTTAAVKAECDVCVTSSNVYKVIEAIPNDKIYFLPDKLMGQNLQNYLKQKKIDKELLVYSSGTCYVHAEFEEDQVEMMRKRHPSLKILAHPECNPSVTALADHVGSTTGIVDYVKAHVNDKDLFLVLTECGIISRLQVECPEAKMIGTCMMCKYMKSNHLEHIKQALLKPLPSQIIELDTSIQKRALRSLQAMFEYAG